MMKLNPVKPRKSLNKAWLKTKPNRTNIELFKQNLSYLLSQINETESEEFQKNLVSDFLKNTWYQDKFFINTKDREDLAIYTGRDSVSPVGVIIETKKPTNKAEMLSVDNINTKALHELILYYLRERISGKNLELKYLIATNIYEWFIFNATDFEKWFAKNKPFVKKFIEFEEKRLSGTDTDFFYRNIATPFIENLQEEITFSYFDLRTVKRFLDDQNPDKDVKLIPFYKIFSPEHLLKLPFANDSNSLDRGFYNELLHIIGLEETKEGSKKVIGRKAESKRNPGSLIENTINILNYEDCLSSLKRSEYGVKKEEQLFNVALELSITWINRILFLKLLEGQLVRYHRGDKSYRFLNTERIPDYGTLNKLFFQVLAEKENERKDQVNKRFGNIPYLNSSLFEPNELEHKTIRISNLENEYNLPLLSVTVITNHNGKRQKGEKNTLHYLFEFLDAYDFASEGSEEIQEENKTLINASVLGLIFEKINGYKDGSFFTPGFITMYMARETVRRSVIQKFNEIKGWNCNNVDELYNQIDNKQEANDIINGLKVCDPAVGSGHFLVSVLNEIIALKSDLKILSDRNGRILRDYHIEVTNDELVITDDDGCFFEYRPGNIEKQRVQEAIFHEKQTIIENCLFGVDINPNSVKICRLRLWIELLKNAYYKPGTKELETLPNIDINIKCGNSLISRYSLDSDLKQLLKNSKYGVDGYRLAVQTYRNAKDKEQKHEMLQLIETIKKDFETEIKRTDKRVKELNKLKSNLLSLTGNQLFEYDEKQKKEWSKKVKVLTEKIKKREAELEDIANNKIYDNSFEWRFEFPEVLNDEGDFIGFDIVIGNPPYINAINFKKRVGEQEYSYYKRFFETAKGTVDAYIYFFELAYRIMKNKQIFCFITPNRYLSANYAVALRKYLIEKFVFKIIVDYSNVKVFEEAATYPVVTLLKKRNPTKDYEFKSFTYTEGNNKTLERVFNSSLLTSFNDNILGFILSAKFPITQKLIRQSVKLTEAGEINATSTAGEAEKFHEFISEDESGFKLINTGTIDRYLTTWGKSELIDKGIKYLKPYLPKNQIYLGLNRYKLYSSPKIIFAKIAIRTESYFDEKGEYASINTNCMHNFKNNYDPYYILGWLNSKLFQFIYECLFDGLKMAGGYLLYSSPNLSNMYIKKVESAIQIKIAKKVSQIIGIKKQNIEADTSWLETEIDQIFFKIYGLTNEEIAFIEKHPL